MQLPIKISDNFHFLIAEVSLQVSNLIAWCDNRSPLFKKRIIERSGYVYNLKAGIHNSCLKQISENNLSSVEQVSLKSIELIATDLEQLTELCRECVSKTESIKKKYFRQLHGLKKLMRQIEAAIALIEPALFDRQTELAIKISHAKTKLDRDCERLTDRYITHIKKKKDTQSLISTLFVINEIERMGEKLLDISESILSANLGHPINFERFFSLQSSLAQFDVLPKGTTNDDLVLETLAETRSGSTISGLGQKALNGNYLAVYKDGKKQKLIEERKGVESWDAIAPGLAPKILGFHNEGNSASLLIEHLDGLTFEKIILNSPPEQILDALKQLNKTLKSVWKNSMRQEAVNAHFMQQLLSRLDDVYAVHPEYQDSSAWIGDCKQPSFAELVKQAEALEENYPAPFSVYIHGDFNLDNIIFEPENKRINYIDLHRSRYMDYVQDVSVLMVSNYRMQIFDTDKRQKFLAFACLFYRYARRFAKKQQDHTFDIRLALGLARSFVTSTRFILDKSLSQAMFYRARYIIERLLEANLNKPHKFKLPIREIFNG
jgi:phosphate uptake regulator/aminoglycoside phosphotransferase